jgi:hypothetical protein
MGRELIAGLPGQQDINGQFTAQNLPKTLRDLKKLLQNGNGNYQFGSLTAAYYGYLPGTPEYINWMEEVALYDKNARDKIKKAVIDAVNHQPHPLPITFTWNPAGSPQDVTVTPLPSSYNPTSYSIDIVGYPAPAVSALADRRNKKKT